MQQHSNSKRSISSGGGDQERSRVNNPNGEKPRGKVLSNNKPISDNGSNSKKADKVVRDVSNSKSSLANGRTKEKTNVVGSRTAAAIGQAGKPAAASKKNISSKMASSGNSSKQIDSGKEGPAVKSKSSKTGDRTKEKAISDSTMQSPEPMIRPTAPTTAIRHCLFREDKSVLSPRPSCKVYYRNTDGLLTIVEKYDIDSRLRRWDPFWKW